MSLAVLYEELRIVPANGGVELRGKRPEAVQRKHRTHFWRIRRQRRGDSVRELVSPTALVERSLYPW
jgi:hypothetical protein